MALIFNIFIDYTINLTIMKQTTEYTIVLLLSLAPDCIFVAVHIF